MKPANSFSDRVKEMRERLFKKSFEGGRQHREQSARIKRYLIRDVAETIPASYENKPDEYIRLVCINRNLRIQQSVVYEACRRNRITGDYELFKAAESFARNGDRLCSYLVDFANKKGYRNLWYFNGDHGGIVERMIKRNLTEAEYALRLEQIMKELSPVLVEGAAGQG